MFDIFADFRERACVWRNKEFSQACLVRECIRSRGEKSDNGIARLRRERMQRVSAKSDSSISCCTHWLVSIEYLTRRDMDGTRSYRV